MSRSRWPSIGDHVSPLEYPALLAFLGEHLCEACMSVDIEVRMELPVAAGELKESVAEALARLVGAHLAPRVTLTKGRRSRADVPPELPASTMVGQRDAVYVLGYEGRDDQVAVVTTAADASLGLEHAYVCFSIGATRDDTEYVLGLAGAIGLARTVGVDVEGSSACGLVGEAEAPTELVERLRLRSSVATFDEACRLVLRRTKLESADRED